MHMTSKTYEAIEALLVRLKASVANAEAIPEPVLYAVIISALRRCGLLRDKQMDTGFIAYDLKRGWPLKKACLEMIDDAVKDAAARLAVGQAIQNAEPILHPALDQLMSLSFAASGSRQPYHDFLLAHLTVLEDMGTVKRFEAAGITIWKFSDPRMAQLWAGG
jgi:hypothetical protein